VRGLVKILLGGFVVFMSLSIAQNWEYFSSAWFGQEPPLAPLSDEEREAAANAVERTLSMMRHIYLSGGDPRFAERIPAADGIVREILDDVSYLARNRRIQDPELLGFDVTTVDRLGNDRVEIRTRERWRVRVLWAHGGDDAEPPRVETVLGRYLVVRGGRGWRVEGWEIVDPRDDADAGT
jgi:hypothetical protein